MKKFIQSGKFNVFALFLILAILTSLIAKLTSTYDKDITFKLVVVDQPKNKLIFDKSHDSIVIKLRGFGFNLLKYYLNPPEFKISVKKLKEQNNSFIWNQNDNFKETRLNFDTSVELLTISEDSIFLYYDEFASQTKIIKPNVTINYMPGFINFFSSTLSADSIEVLGPKDILNKIKFIETEELILNNINSDIVANLKLIKPEFDNITIIEKEVEYKMNVDQYTEEVINVPVNILSNTSSVYNYYPKEISIKYFISINDYKKTTPLDFRVDCDFNKDKEFLIPKLTKKPNYIKNPRLSTNQIQLIILE